MIRCCLRALMIVLLAPSSPGVAATPNPFVPAVELIPDVAFWKRVYAEVATTGGLLHDDRHLDVVYEVIAFPPGLESAARSRIVDAAKAKYARILRELATGRREGLSTDEQRVLALWGRRADPDLLRQAVQRLRFQLGQADRFREGLIRSGTWEEHVAQTLKAQGLPPELAALPHVESSFDPLAGSKVGAAGLWQFMPATGRRWLRVDSVVDERYDPYRSTVAAAQYLSLNYSILGTWPLALTAYNHGAGGMRRAKEMMGTDDIVTILRYYQSPTFGFASRNFYLSFLAALDIDRNAEKYFGPLLRNAPEDYRSVRVPAYVPVAALERHLQIDRTTLRNLNLALRPSVWEGRRLIPRGYELRVPSSGTGPDAATALANLGAGEQFAQQIGDASHTVRRGETLGHIARRHGTTVAWLMRENRLRSARSLRVGQVLRLPGEISVREAEAVIARDSEVYMVRRGDTLSGIAQRTGVREKELMARNLLRNRDAIYEGQRLLLAGKPVAPPAGSDEEASGRVAEAPGAAAVETSRMSEPVSYEEAAAESPTLAAGGAAVTTADPTDYSVDARGTIVVQAAETLGHYADWLGVRAADLRERNRMKSSQALRVGRRLVLDLSRVTAKEFEQRRVAYHRGLQESFFSAFRIAGTDRHRVQPGESAWLITQKHANLPVWLLRQYNPELDLGNVLPGTELIIPRVTPVAGAGG